MIINMRMFDKDNQKLLKELKRDVGEQLNRYEDILTHLEATYSVKPEKYKVNSEREGPVSCQGHKGGEE